MLLPKMEKYHLMFSTRVTKTESSPIQNTNICFAPKIFNFYCLSEKGLPFSTLRMLLMAPVLVDQHGSGNILFAWQGRKREILLSDPALHMFSFLPSLFAWPAAPGRQPVARDGHSVSRRRVVFHQMESRIEYPRPEKLVNTVFVCPFPTSKKYVIVYHVSL